MQTFLSLPGGWLGALVLTIVGLVMCFSGSKILRLALGFSGFLIVGTIAATIVALVTHSTIWTTLAFLVLGLVGGGIAGLLLTPGMFLLGLAFGYSACSAFFASEIAAWIAALIAGILFAILQKRVLAAGTAGLGAILALEGLFIVFLEIPTFDFILTPLLEGRAGGIAIAILWVLLSLAGYRAQLRGRKKRKQKESED
ncbi:MAG: hypothetical protein JRG91_21105 [Deltaproteobacteria bacterium]|nr:hypothetical protein [Deltaproteobacteria bacterium]